MPADPRPVLVAPDAFKGTLTAAQVAGAIGRGLEQAGVPADLCPVADGGEGTLAVLLTALGGETAGTRAHDPLGRKIAAGFALIENGGTAIVEVAEASGLPRVAPEERDVMAATTHGTGELIAAAIDAGAAVVLVAAGGSATVDGGAGAIEAIEAAGGPRGARLVVLCDVRTPWEEAPARFGPQKGASPDQVRTLERRLRALGRELPKDPAGKPMTGAAGGLAGGLWATYGAALEPGAAFVLNTLETDTRMRAARAVVVGEGRLDRTSLQGKVTGELATRARQAGIPCHAVVGENALETFDARILDLQEIVQAGTMDGLQRAGEALAAIL
ncbi:MAG: glycerate kinase [Solirubrobacteraceae bacterium]